MNKSLVLVAASYLTEPVCKMRELLYVGYLPNEKRNKTTKVALFVLWGVAAIFGTPLGIGLRKGVACLETRPFVYVEKIGRSLTLAKTVTVFSHNVCWMPAGYSITDGQLTLPAQRRDRAIDKILEMDPDFVTLQEVPDICDALHAASRLSKYPFVIPYAGTKAIGPNSMLWVGSKHKIAEESIYFIPFVKDVELTGRARHSEKGFLSFDLAYYSISIVTTHLQHSEVPVSPTVQETDARELQMKKIAEHIRQKVDLGRTVIFTGDLNEDEKELSQFFIGQNVVGWKRDESIKGKPTWGGDSWAANIMKKPASGPLVLDYTFVISRKETRISTQILDVGYSGEEFCVEAASDHTPLLTTITLL